MENLNDLQADSALLDCGVASEETKGFHAFLMYELTPPPFDRMFIP